MSAATASSLPAHAAMVPQLATFLIDGSLTRPEYLKLIAPRGAAESLVKRILENLRVEKDGSNKGKQQQVSGPPGPGPGKGKAAAKVGAGTTMRPLLIATIVTACPDVAAVAASSSFASSSTKPAAAVIASDLTASVTEGTAAGESSRNAEASSSTSAPDQVGSTSSLADPLHSSLGPLTPPILFHHTFQPYDAFLAALPQLANYFPPARGAAQEAQESGSGASSLSFSSTAEHWLPFGAGLGARLSRFLVNEQERNQAGQQRQQGNGEFSSAPVATDEGLFVGFLAASEMVEEHVLARRRRSRIVLARRPKEGKGEDEVEPYLVVMSGRDPRVPDGGVDAIAPTGSSSRIVMTTTRLLSPSLSPEDSRAKTERPAGGDQTPSSLAVPLAPTDLTAEFSPASAADGFEQQQQRQHRSRCSRSCWNRSQKRDDWGWVDVAQELESQRARLAVVIATPGDTPKEAGPTDGGSSVLSNLVDRLKAVHGTNENAWWVNASNGFKSDILGFTKSEPIAPAEPSSATPLTDKNINGKRPIDAANSPLEQDLAMEAKRFKADAEAARAQKLAAAAQFATKGAIVASAGNLTPHQLSLMQQARAIQAQAHLANGTDPAAAAAAAMIANAQQAGANQQQTPAMQAEIARRAAVDAAAGASQPTSAPPQQPNRPSVSVWRGKLASRPTGRNEQGQIIFDPVAPSVEAVIMPTANVNSFHVDRWPAGYLSISAVRKLDMPGLQTLVRGGACVFLEFQARVQPGEDEQGNRGLLNNLAHKLFNSKIMFVYHFGPIPGGGVVLVPHRANAESPYKLLGACFFNAPVPPQLGALQVPQPQQAQQPQQGPPQIPQGPQVQAYGQPAAPQNRPPGPPNGAISDIDRLRAALSKMPNINVNALSHDQLAALAAQLAQKRAAAAASAATAT